MICTDHQDELAPATTHGRTSNSVSADVDRLLSPKSLKELEVLEKQISGKLQSNEPIDVEYWEHLLRSVAVYQSRAELNAVYKTIIESRLDALRQEQRVEASSTKKTLSLLLTGSDRKLCPQTPALLYTRHLDPEPLLKLRAEDKSLDITDEKDFKDKNVSPGLLQSSLSIAHQCFIGFRKAKSHEVEVCALTTNAIRQTSPGICPQACRSSSNECIPLCVRSQRRFLLSYQGIIRKRSCKGDPRRRGDFCWRRRGVFYIKAAMGKQV